MTELVSALLRRRIRTAGAGPLLTYYDLDSGERTELSAVSLGNWVAKTANLILDELLLGPGDRIALPLAGGHPGHWVSAVWELACWQAGVAVVLDGPADAVVAGPEAIEESPVPTTGGNIPRSNAPLVVCSLHPFGLPLGAVPAGALDYNLEVRAQADRFGGTDPAAGDLAWDDGEQRLTQAQLVVAVLPESGRLLVRPLDAWSGAAALVGAIAGGGSLVTVVGPEAPDQLSRIAAAERAQR